MIDKGINFKCADCGTEAYLLKETVGDERTGFEQCVNCDAEICSVCVEEHHHP